MYEFLATFENLETGNEVTQKISIDLLPLDAEDVNYNRDAYAWMHATEIALAAFPESSPFSLSSVEFISCS